MLTTRDEKVAHLLRKFGFGASRREMAKFDGQTLEQVVDFLVDCKPEPRIPGVRWAYREGKEAEPYAPQFRVGWIYGMVTGQNPLAAKLSVFWHDHFAVSDIKVEDGLMMLEYVDALRADPAGEFKGILRRVVQTPAFLKHLDVNLTAKSRPNENFARELLELYTLGIGNYTEQDIKETARALTGWTWMNRYYEFEGTHDSRLYRLMETGMPYSLFCYAPSVHDDSEKTILGRKSKFNGETLLDMLAARPETAQFICTKLWDRFVYESPEPALIQDLASVFVKSNGRIRSVLKRMTLRPEFWSEKAQSGRIKSPVELVVGMDRAYGLDKIYPTLISEKDPYTKPIPQKAMEALGAASYFLEIMGMPLLYPPDVAGWNWHEGWISSVTILKRAAYRSVLQWRMEKPDYYVPDLALRPVIEEYRKAKTESPEEAAAYLCEFHGVLATDSTKKTLAQIFAAMGWSTNRKDDRAAGWIITSATALLANSPEYQLT